MTRDLSVVVPAYNEADRIGTTLDSIASYLDARDLDVEVIVVDDGSTDDTQAVVRSVDERFRHLRVLPVGSGCQPVRRSGSPPRSTTSPAATRRTSRRASPSR